MPFTKFLSASVRGPLSTEHLSREFVLSLFLYILLFAAFKLFCQVSLLCGENVQADGFRAALTILES